MQKHQGNKDDPIIYAPVYKCGQLMKDLPKYKGITDTLMGYCQQSLLVQKDIETYIQNFLNEGKSKTLIVEGVHLDP